MLKDYEDVLPIKSLILCVKCGKPLYTNGLQKKCLDMLLDGLKNSHAESDIIIYSEILDQCLKCAIYHPDLWPYIPRKERKMIELSLKFGG